MNKQFNQRRFNIAPTSSISLYFSLLSIKIRTLLAFAVLLTTVIFIQSCEKNEVERRKYPADKFSMSVEKHSETIGSIAVNSLIDNCPSIQYPTKATIPDINSIEGKHRIYVKFPFSQTIPNILHNINGIAQLVTFYNGTLSSESKANSISFLVPIEEVEVALFPLISEAKMYLKAKGLTAYDIETVLVDLGGQEVGLILLALVLSELEIRKRDKADPNFASLLFPTAYAGDVGDCLMIAVGVHGIATLMMSYDEVSTWSVRAIAKAIKPILKRIKGPIGVAVVISSFGLCMGGWN